MLGAVELARRSANSLVRGSDEPTDRPFLRATPAALALAFHHGKPRMEAIANGKGEERKWRSSSARGNMMKQKRQGGRCPLTIRETSRERGANRGDVVGEIGQPCSRRIGGTTVYHARVWGRSLSPPMTMQGMGPLYRQLANPMIGWLGCLAGKPLPGLPSGPTADVASRESLRRTRVDVPRRSLEFGLLNTAMEDLHGCWFFVTAGPNSAHPSCRSRNLLSEDGWFWRRIINDANPLRQGWLSRRRWLKSVALGLQGVSIMSPREVTIRGAGL